MKGLAACALLAACGSSEPAPAPSDDSLAEPAIEQGDTEAAIARARATLAEARKGRADLARPAADLLEGLLAEDPSRIGAALTELAHNLPRAVSGQ